MMMLGRILTFLLGVDNFSGGELLNFRGGLSFESYGTWSMYIVYPIDNEDNSSNRYVSISTFTPGWYPHQFASPKGAVRFQRASARPPAPRH